MVIVKEDKSAMDTIKAFKKIADLFAMIFITLNRLERTLAVLNFSESYLREGTMADRRRAQEDIKKLQLYINELDQIYLSFQQEDIKTSFEKKQHELNKAGINIPAIRETMISIWSIKNSGITEDDNKKIKDLIELMFTNVNKTIRSIQEYVKEFNQVSVRKLTFNMKWTPLSK